MSKIKKENKKIDLKNNKKLLIVIGIILLVVVGVVLFFTLGNNDPKKNRPTTNENGDKLIYNDKEAVVGDKELDGVVFTDIECVFDGNRSLLTYKVTNKSKKTISLGDYDLVIKDEKEEIIAMIVPGSRKELKPGESLEDGNSIDIDLSNIHSIELRKVK